MQRTPSDSNNRSQSLDGQCYLAANEFFIGNLPFGLTFDDVSLATNYSQILPRNTMLETRLSESLRLQAPIISSDMDTVTEADMAIAMALNGGMGIIHYNMTEDMQVKEIARVKNHVHGLIQEPITVKPDQTIGEVIDVIDSKNFKFRTFPVVDEKGCLLGLLTGGAVKRRYADKKVAEAMTPRNKVLAINEKEIADDPIAVADQFFNDHMRIHKLLIVDDDNRLCGLFTLSDVERITDEATSRNKPARDSNFRLVCSAAVATSRTQSGELDRDRLTRHVERLVAEGVDAIAISTAHGHTSGVGDAVRLLRGVFPDLTLIAGNVTSAEGVAYLADSGANTIKVGQGPGSICTTRIIAGVGIPQLTALYIATREAAQKGVTIIADGGINKSGDIVKALTLTDAVICGGLLAGCREAPGKIVEIHGKLYKQYRGMGSEEAMKAGSATRYGHENNDPSRKIAAEGIEALKEVTGSITETLSQLIGGIQSGMGYLGASTLAELKEKARYIRVTPAGLREAAPHDIVEIKTTKDV